MARLRQYCHLLSQLIQQLESTSVFGPFFTGDALQRFSFQTQRQLPAPGAFPLAIDGLPELVIAGMEMAPLAQAIAKRAEHMTIIADTVDRLDMAAGSQ